MKINYYRFPETVDAHTRYINGALQKDAYCELGKEDCCNCSICENGWSDCKHFICTEAEDTVIGCTIREAKRLLREFGGCAWTEHYERDGGMFETSEIVLKGNNSKHKYNRHL